ncbi:MAG: DegQ family serine endoprotease [Gammaproteobacteria bacterium]|nr:DegQ family serine endoprotease [Gammaproteobacteria bacterium]
MRYLFSLLLLCSLGVQAALPTHDSQGEALPSLAPMLDRTIPSVVNIFTRTRVAVQQSPLLADPFFRRFFSLPEAQPRERTQQSLGSGVVIDGGRGYIVTNHHVIDRADEIAVNLHDGRTLKATLVGSDPETDIAVLKVENGELAALPMSDSERLRVGDFVVAIGNPFGLGQTVTSGIVSALGRSGLGIEGFEDFIQTDASINPGNSGGALVNLRGELVGINTAILSKSGGNVGIGFAIPINMVREIMGQLIEHGEVKRGSMGAQAQDLTPELAAAFNLERHQGAVVTQVSGGSPAAKAGLKTGDVITHINDRPVRDAADVRNRIGLLRIGERVALRILRDGKALTLHALVEEPEVVALEGEQLHPRLGGAVLANVVEETVRGRVEGVVVAAVAPGSAAMLAGLRKGDLIAQANRREVKNLEELQAAVSADSALLLNIQRRDGALYLLLQ